MMTEKYNGYTNYETWNVSLWIDNDQGDQEHWLAQARETLARQERASKSADTFIGTTHQRAAYDLAQELKDSFIENAPELHGTYADLLGAAMGEVNWYEIAENLIEAAEEIPA